MKNYTLFEQMYIKCGRNKKHYKTMRMTISEIIDDVIESSNTFKLFILYIQLNLVKQPSLSWEEAQTLLFDYNNKSLLNFVGSNKQLFYKTLKELVDIHILFKGDKPKQYIVNPFYISCCSEAQMEQFHHTMTCNFAESQQVESAPVPHEYLVEDHQVKVK